jgi:Putative transposase
VAQDWLRREADLLPVGYFHLVFTLPDEIAPIAHQNKSVYDLLFRAAAETLLTIAADPKHLGARISATAVLHSWDSVMTHHPHAHIIVPGNGISLDGARWLRCKPGFLLPVRISPACSGASSWLRSPTPTRRASWHSSARSRIYVVARHSRHISPRSNGRTAE